MFNYHKVWAHLLSENKVRSHHIVEYCIVKAIFASKGKQKKAEKLVLQYLSKAFTPIKRKNRLENGEQKFTALYRAIYQMGLNSEIVLGVPAKALDSNYDLYKKLFQFVLTGKHKIEEYFNRKYVYIFVRQDLSKEYQLVQAAHVAMKAGYELCHSQGICKDHRDCDPDHLYFTVVGVANEHELRKSIQELTDKSVEFVVFREPDIGNEITAVASMPIAVNKRGSLLKHKLLSFTLGEFPPKLDQAA